MGSPIEPSVKEVQEAAAALVSVAEALGPKLDGGLTIDEAVQAWEESAVAVEKGATGLSPAVIAEAFKASPEEVAELALVSLAKAAGALVGKPAAPVEKSDAVEVVEAVGSVALSVLNAVPTRSIPAAVLGALVVNRAKIKDAVEGRLAIGAQFAANPFGQGLAVGCSVLGYVKALRGVAIALKAAG